MLVVDFNSVLYEPLQNPKVGITGSYATLN